MDLLPFVEAKINHYGKAIVTGGDKMDDLALGELTFYIALRRGLKGTASTEDKGLLDAVNDTLQELGLVDKNSSFYGKMAQ
jgi:hypothetical protein